MPHNESGCVNKPVMSYVLCYSSYDSNMATDIDRYISYNSAEYIAVTDTDYIMIIASSVLHMRL